MMAMRERASHRGRPRRRKGAASQTPLDQAPREDALPLEDLGYDPESMPPPPAARGEHPNDSEQPGDALDTPIDTPIDTPGEAAGEAIGDDVLPAAAPERPRPTKRSGRPSVPSWDDVMFGAKPRD
jgi:hypothetical protein